MMMESKFATARMKVPENGTLNSVDTSLKVYVRTGLKVAAAK